jgi:hypothetical protein
VADGKTFSVNDGWTCYSQDITAEPALSLAAEEWHFDQVSDGRRPRIMKV